MKLFEACYRDGFKTYQRFYDTVKGVSLTDEISGSYSYFEESENGPFACIVDNGKRYVERQGRSQQARGMPGVVHPFTRLIRDEYWENESEGGDSRYNVSYIRIMYLDIETRVGTCSTGFPVPEVAAEPISLIQIHDSRSETTYILGLRDFVHEKQFISKFNYPVKYVKLPDEISLINAFITVFKRLNPLVIYAWNGNGFDFPYLYNRFKRLGIEESLSVYGNWELKSNEFMGQIEYKLISPGHFFVDLKDVYQKFTFSPRTSYSLENISQVELGAGKIDHSCYEKFDDFYTGKYNIPKRPTQEQLNSEIYKAAIAGDWNEVRELAHSEFVYYGITDVDILKNLDSKLGLTNLMVSLAKKMGVQFNEALGTVSPWTSFIQNTAYAKNLILPVRPDEKPIVQGIVGGYVREPQKGKHKFVLSNDFSSLYPSIIRSSNMSPETYVPMHKLPADLFAIVSKYFKGQNEDLLFDVPDRVWIELNKLLVKYNYSIGINGAVFKCDKTGIIPTLVDGIFKSRKFKKGKAFEIDTALSAIKDDIHDYGETPEKLSLVAKLVGEYIKYNGGQTADKLSINSLYGALGNASFILFNEEIARAITGNGRFLIKMVANKVEEHLQSLIPSRSPYVIAGDTDSFYYQIELFVKEYIKQRKAGLESPFLSKQVFTDVNQYVGVSGDIELNELIDFCNQFEIDIIQPQVAIAIKDFATKMNCVRPEVLDAEREIIADVAVFVAKKKYMARVIDSEGKRYHIDDPKIKIMGLELIKSSTPKFTKDKIMEFIPVIFDGDEAMLRSELQRVKKLFIEADLNDIAGVGGVSRIDYQLGDKGIPIGSRAAIVHNEYTRKKGIQGKFNAISAGDKCKRLFLRLPNQFNSNIVAYTNEEFTEELLQHKNIIDYDTNFEKMFLKPLQIMVDSLGYNLNKETDVLEEW